MDTDIKKLATRFFEEVWNQGKVAVVDELLAPDYEGNLPMVGTLNRDALKETVKVYRDAFPDLHFELKDTLGDGDRVIVHWVGTGTNKKPFMGIPATGTTTSVEGFSIIRTQNGKSYRDNTQYDVLQFLKGIGIELPAQSTARPTAKAPVEVARH